MLAKVLKAVGLPLEGHLRAVHHAGVVDRADDRVARRGPHVLGGIEVEDVHLPCGLVGSDSQCARCGSRSP